MKTLLLLPIAIIPFLEPQDPTSRRHVLRESGMASVEVRRDLRYWTRDDGELRFNTYSPSGMEAGEQRPAVLLMNGTGPELKDWAQYEDWGRLCAASGLIAVTFQARRNATTDFDDLLVNLTGQAEDLGIDPGRIGIWACSANVRSSVPWVMQASLYNVRCAVFYYGVMSSANIRRDLPMYVVRAGLDAAVINETIAEFSQAALKANAPLTLVNHASGHHGFDIRDDTAETRRIIRRTVQFLKSELESL